jgi:hypothetical protein
LPILLAAWSFLLSSIGALPEGSTARLCLLAALIIIYGVAVLFTKRAEGAHSRNLRGIMHIQNRLESRVGKYHGLASFDYIRQRVNSSYTDPFLFSLIDQFPRDLMRITCKGEQPGTTKPGLKLVQQHDDEVV